MKHRAVEYCLPSDCAFTLKVRPAATWTTCIIIWKLDAVLDKYQNGLHLCKVHNPPKYTFASYMM